jgi:hypothetical protein
VSWKVVSGKHVLNIKFQGLKHNRHCEEPEHSEGDEAISLPELAYPLASLAARNDVRNCCAGYFLSFADVSAGRRKSHS